MVGLERTIEAVTGQSPGRAQLDQFARYLQLILTWNRVQRLTGSRDANGIVRDLFGDSILYLSQIPQETRRILDLGSGQGIPGLPIHITWPHTSMTVVEAKGKRVSFLLTVRRELGLSGATVLEGRAEILIQGRPELKGSFDAVVSRSVGPSLLESAQEYLRPGGLYVCGASPPGPVPEQVSGIVEATRSSLSISKLGIERSFVIARRPA